MIKLTNDASGESGNPLYVSPESITGIRPWDDTTRVDTGESKYFVTESPEEVTRKILEYKLGMQMYRSYSLAWMTETRNDWKDDHFQGMEISGKIFERLAGLEE